MLARNDCRASSTTWRSCVCEEASTVVLVIVTVDGGLGGRLAGGAAGEGEGEGDGEFEVEDDGVPVAIKGNADDGVAVAERSEGANPVAAAGVLVTSGASRFLLIVDVLAGGFAAVAVAVAAGLLLKTEVEGVEGTLYASGGLPSRGVGATDEDDEDEVVAAAAAAAALAATAARPGVNWKARDWTESPPDANNASFITGAASDCRS